MDGTTISYILRWSVLSTFRRFLLCGNFYIQAVSLFGSIINTLQVKQGFGQHVEYVVHNLGPIVMYTTIASIQNGIGTFLVKSSVCILVLRLIKGTHPRIRIILWFFITALLLFTLATLLVVGLQCIPMRKIWHPETPGFCIAKHVQPQLIRILGGGNQTLGYGFVLISHQQRLVLPPTLSVSSSLLSLSEVFR